MKEKIINILNDFISPEGFEIPACIDIDHIPKIAARIVEEVTPSGDEAKNKTSASSMYMGKHNNLDAALSYREDNLINMMPQLNVLFKQRLHAARMVRMGNNEGWEMIEYIDNQIKQLLGLK
jgi:hypothetical protein